MRPIDLRDDMRAGVRLSQAQSGRERNMLLAQVRANARAADRAADRSTWHGAAFVLESVLLVLFLAISLTVTVSLFAASHNVGEGAHRQSVAIELATGGSQNGAEAFAANPLAKVDDVLYYQELQGAITPVSASAAQNASAQQPVYKVERTVVQEEGGSGILYRAHISVSCQGQELYQLDTARYVSGGGGE